MEGDKYEIRVLSRRYCIQELEEAAAASEVCEIEELRNAVWYARALTPPRLIADGVIICRGGLTNDSRRARHLLAASTTAFVTCQIVLPRPTRPIDKSRTGSRPALWPIRLQHEKGRPDRNNYSQTDAVRPLHKRHKRPPAHRFSFLISGNPFAAFRCPSFSSLADSVHSYCMFTTSPSRSDTPPLSYPHLAREESTTPFLPFTRSASTYVRLFPTR
ncbi:hypothetical protein EVAR_77545_1 [Eumeta japonica]|uniref:Uncharacterized protein n=1 Tax=Eumeta variegata TaxID=151549 RepID=A0A4C1T9G3_EUMVA|nr:hypothetical protein EVAR_77545_1 [Eumeta japonica]